MIVRWAIEGFGRMANNAVMHASTVTTPRIQSITDIDVSGKTVPVRADLNVPMRNTKVADATRLEGILPTIRYLVARKSRVVLHSHLVRPSGRETELSLAPVARRLGDMLREVPVSFVPDSIGNTARERVARMAPGEVAVLENVRFYEGEESDDHEFAGQLGSLGQIYVNDAFSCAHRAHSSTHAIARYLPACAGLSMQAELAASRGSACDRGGDTAAALNAAGATDGFTYVSTAGGAFLEWLEGKTLRGVAALAESATTTTPRTKGRSIMARITLRQLLDHAAEHGYGVPAFNINNMEQGLAIMEAAEATDSPVILQASRGARSYANDIMLEKIMEALELMYPAIPICIHQDHGNNVATCLSAIQHGFTSVMMDGSLKEDAKTPADYSYNVKITKQVAELAHMVGASVEGELGCLGSLETGHGDAEDGHGAEGKLDRSILLTDPDQASRFVAETKVDALAVAIGTSHGAYKFTRRPTGDVLAMDVIEQIHSRLPDTHIVMHGSSSVPKEWQEVFNQHGGKMRETYGVPVDEIVRGIRHGVRKINIETDLRLAAAAEFRRVAASSKSEFDPRKFLRPAMDAMSAICRERFEAFGTAGHAATIKVIPMSEMAKRYEKGVLDPNIPVAKAA